MGFSDIIRTWLDMFISNKRKDVCRGCGASLKGRLTITLCSSPKCGDKWFSMNKKAKLKAHNYFLRKPYKCPICKIKTMGTRGVSRSYTCGKCGGNYYY